MNGPLVELQAISDETVGMGVSKSHIQTFPSEMLGEIFILCLPPDPMIHRQPDVTIAPIILCHICSHWRGVALGMPQLWQHLFFILRISVPTSPNNKLFAREIHPDDREFLRWWQQRLGCISSNLRLGVRWLKNHPNNWKTEDEDKSFMCLLLSARYLDMDKDFGCVLRTYLADNFLDTTSLTKTLVLRGGSQGFKGVSRHFSKDVSFDTKLIPFSIAHDLIRRIFLEAMTIKDSNVADIGWSHLTHLILVKTAISTHAWFEMIGECVNLESAIFHIQGLAEPGIIEDPSARTLPRLRQLVVKWDPLEFKKSIFQNLHLPALTALRLNSILTVEELHQLLKSTPALKELHLSYRIPADPDRYTKRGLFPSAGSDIEPISSCIPNLEHLVLQLNLFWNREYREMRHFRNTLSKTPWLQFGGQRNQIKRVDLTADYSESRKKLVESLERVGRVIDGVRVAARNDNPWERDDELHGQYIGSCFDDLGFELR